MLIDAHQHFWDPARGDYGWLKPGTPLHRRYAPTDLAPLLDQAGVGGSILIQAAPSVAETDYLLGIATAVPWVLGVVGWIDLAEVDAEREIARRAGNPSFVGIRPMLQDLDDRRWILRAVPTKTIALVAQRGLAFDALVHHDQIDTIITLAGAHPSLRIVIDHAAKPPFGDAFALRQWRAAIGRAARCPNIHCKLSGLLTELPAFGSRDLVADCVALLIDLFGPERLIWGSDWPVLTLAADYAAWRDQAASLLGALSDQERAAVFGGNALAFYRLPAPQSGRERRAM